MTTVLTMTQGMRSQYCASTANALSSLGDVIIVVSDRAVLARSEIPDLVKVVEIRPSQDVLPTTRLVKSRLRQRIVNYSREGSSFGRFLERTARSTMWRLRYLDRMVLGGRSIKESRSLGAVQPLLLETLRSIDQEHTVDRVVAFDLFDVPTIMEFGSGRDIRVEIR